MKILKKIFSALASLAIVIVPAITTSTASAVTTSPTSVTITKLVHEVSNSVTNTFTYEVEEDSSNPQTNLAGLPSTFTIAFSNKTPEAGTTTAKQTGTLDFSAVNFTKVGDYKFKITEVASSDTDNIYPVDTDYWYAYVSVRYVTDNDPTKTSGTPTTTIEATTATVGTENTDNPINPNATAVPPVTGNKSAITFESTPEFTYIELSKKVTGNLGDINHYFAFTVKLGSNMANKSIVVSDKAGNGFSTNGTSNVASSPVAVTTNASGDLTLYLKHSQEVKIGLRSDNKSQIPLKIKSGNTVANAQYTVIETPEAADTFYPKKTYTILIDGVETANGSKTKTLAAVPANMANATAADTIAFKNNNVTAYVNNKEADPITGFFVNYWPFVVLVIIGIVGMCLIRRTLKRKN